MFEENLCKIQGQFKVGKSQAETNLHTEKLLIKFLPSQNIFPRICCSLSEPGFHKKELEIAVIHYVILFPECH